MPNTTDPDDVANSDRVIIESEEAFLRAWDCPIGANRRRPKKTPPESLITPEDRDVREYDLWENLVLKREFARPFEGRLPMQVPAGCYVCKPVIGQLQKVPEARGPIPYYCLAMVVAVGRHKGKIIPWYWPYPGKEHDDFWLDCQAAGVDPDHMDLGCGFAAGGLHVVVREVQEGKHSYRKVSSVTKLASLIPEAIWPTVADKPSVRAARTQAMRGAVAAAASLNADGAAHEQHANDDNEQVS